MRHARRFCRMQQVPAGAILAVTRQFVEARARPEVCLDAPVAFQQICGGDGFQEYRPRTEQLHARAVRRGTFLELVHALENSGGGVGGHGRMLVVLVHHRQVIEHVFLLAHHAAQAVLHDRGDFVGEGRVVGNAVRHRAGEHLGMAVLVLQPFAVERGASRRAADQKAPCALVAGRPHQVHGALHAEHGITDIHRDHLHAVRRVAGAGGDPVGHGPGLVDAFLQDLAVLLFLVEHHLVGILRHVVLAVLVPDADLAEEAFHAEGARFVDHDRHHALADDLVLEHDIERAHECHRGGEFAALAARLQQGVEGRQGRHRQRLGRAPARRQVTAERHAPLAHVVEFRRALGEGQVGQLLQVCILHRQLEAIAEGLDRCGAHLLLLVGDVLRLAGFAHAVALDGLGQDHRRLSGMRHGGCIGRVDLVRIVPAAVQAPDVVIRPGRHHLQQFRILAEEVLAHVSAILRLEGLIIAVDAFHHALLQEPGLVLCQQRVPVAAPDHLDHVPAGAAKIGFQFLDDLAVAAHRAVEALQVAVDDENQVVQALASGHADGTHRFRLVHLAVAHEGPYLAAIGRDQAAMLQVLHEARLIDSLQRAEAHRHGGELPEVGHQPRVRIARKPLAIHLATEVVHLLLGQASEHEGARIDPGRRMALRQHQVAAVLFRRRMPEVIEADVVERRRRGVTGDVPAETGVIAIGAQHHDQRVPSRIVANLLLHFVIARRHRLLVGRNGVDVFGVGAVRHVDAGLVTQRNQLLEKEMRPLFAFIGNHGLQCVKPFAGLLRIDI